MKRPVTTAKDIEEIVAISHRLSNCGNELPKFQATASRRQLEKFLRSFGEESTAERVRSLSDEEMQQIFTRAAPIYLEKSNYTRALCISAIEQIEGRPRELIRKRRKRVT
jgi:hypothetical protein